MLTVVALCALVPAQPPMMRPPEVPPFLERVAPPPRVKVEKLPTEVEEAVRKAVYDKGIVTGSQFEGPRAFIEEVAVPKALTDAYEKHPAATIERLSGASFGR